MGTVNVNNGSTQDLRTFPHACRRPVRLPTAADERDQQRALLRRCLQRNSRPGEILEHRLWNLRHQALRRVLHETLRLQAVPFLRVQPDQERVGLSMQRLRFWQVRHDNYARLWPHLHDTRPVRPVLGCLSLCARCVNQPARSQSLVELCAVTSIAYEYWWTLTHAPNSHARSMIQAAA